MDLINKFKNARILVVGDIMIDRYIYGDVFRLSREAPVPVVKIDRESFVLGGAGNVANNLNALGAEALLCSVIGSDSTGGRLMHMMSEQGLDYSGILIDMNTDRPTTIKTRIIGNNSQLARVDNESSKKISNQCKNDILRFVEDHVSGVDAVIISDYNNGVITAGLVHDIREIAVREDKFIVSDPQQDNFDAHKFMDVITSSVNKVGHYCGFKLRDDKALIRASNIVFTKLRCQNLLITRGKKGMALFESHEKRQMTRIPTVDKRVLDVSGAEDAVVSALVLGKAVGMDLKTAAKISNIAAGIAVSKPGTATVSIEELGEVLEDMK